MIIRKTWRSEWFTLLLFFATSIAAVQLSAVLPMSVIKGDIWRQSDLIIYLRLPLFWLVPFFFLALAFVRVYDVGFTFDPAGIHARYGTISFRRKVIAIRFEDVRAVEILQSLADRILNIGIVEISTSATGGIEVIMEGVSNPQWIQELILNAREQSERTSAKVSE